MKKRYKRYQNPGCGFKKGHQMHKGKKLTEVHKNKISKGMKISKRFQKNVRSFERSLKLSKALKGRIFSDEWKRKQSKAKKGMMTGDKNVSKRPDVRRKIALSKIGKPCPEITKKKLSIHWKRRWREDTNFIKKYKKAINLKPNKKETFLIELFEGHDFPFKYVGDFKVIIGGKCPDFIDYKNNKLIEFFGEYWHEIKEEQERINHFKGYGYDCLVIWQNELKDMEKLLCKIRKFNNSLVLENKI
ncbi:MAG: hypothetical protein ABIH37_04005 [archaeon]